MIIFFFTSIVGFLGLYGRKSFRTAVVLSRNDDPVEIHRCTRKTVNPEAYSIAPGIFLISLMMIYC